MGNTDSDCGSNSDSNSDSDPFGQLPDRRNRFGAAITPDDNWSFIIKSIATESVRETNLPIAVFSPEPFSSKK